MWGRNERHGQGSEEGTGHPKKQRTLKAIKHCHRHMWGQSFIILILYYLWAKIKKNTKPGDCSIIGPTSGSFSVWKPTGFANISNTKAAKIHLSSGSLVPLRPTTQSCGLSRTPLHHRAGELISRALGSKTQQSQQPGWSFALQDGFHLRTPSSLFHYTAPGLNSGRNPLSIDTTAVSLLTYRKVIFLRLLLGKCFVTKAIRHRHSLGSKSKPIIFCDHDCFIGNFSFRNEELRPWPHAEVHYRLGFSYVTIAREFNGITHMSKIGHVLFAGPLP